MNNLKNIVFVLSFFYFNLIHGLDYKSVSISEGEIKYNSEESAKETSDQDKVDYELVTIHKAVIPDLDEYEFKPKGIMGFCSLGDGSLVFSLRIPNTYKNIIKIWDLNKNKCIKTFKTVCNMHPETLLELPNNKLLLFDTICPDRIDIFNIKSGKKITTFEIPWDSTSSPYRFKPDTIFVFDKGKKIILLAEDSRYLIVDIESDDVGKVKKIFHTAELGGKVLHYKQINDENVLCKLCDYDHCKYTLYVFNLIENKFNEVMNFDYAVTIWVSLDNKIIMSSDKKIQVYDQSLELQKEYLYQNFEPFKTFINILPVKGLRNIVLEYLGFDENKIRLDNFGDLYSTNTYTISDKKMIKLRKFTENSQFFNRSDLEIWDIESGEYLKKIKIDDSVFIFKVISDDKMVLGFEDGSVKMLRVTGQTSQAQVIEKNNNCCIVS